jgi:hypothetical protein
MRALTSIAVAVSLLGSVATLPAYAAPLSDQSRNVDNPSIELAAGRCGPHHHYVPGHRNHDGHFIRGHCARNH